MVNASTFFFAKEEATGIAPLVKPNLIAQIETATKIITKLICKNQLFN